jgi:hypothetical protein
MKWPIRRTAGGKRIVRSKIDQVGSVVYNDDGTTSICDWAMTGTRWRRVLAKLTRSGMYGVLYESDEHTYLGGWSPSELWEVQHGKRRAA